MTIGFVPKKIGDMMKAEFIPSKHRQGIGRGLQNEYEGYILYDDVEYYGAGAVNKLCRDLVDSGMRGELNIYRKDMLCMIVPDIVKASLRRTGESNKGFYERKWEENPFAKEREKNERA